MLCIFGPLVPHVFVALGTLMMGCRSDAGPGQAQVFEIAVAVHPELITRPIGQSVVLICLHR